MAMDAMNNLEHHEDKSSMLHDEPLLQDIQDEDLLNDSNSMLGMGSATDERDGEFETDFKLLKTN